MTAIERQQSLQGRESGEQQEINFIHVQTVATQKQASCTRAARSKVIRDALKHKRQRLTKERNNFCNVTPEQMQHRHAASTNSPKTPSTATTTPTEIRPDISNCVSMQRLGVSKLDPFHTLGADANELVPLFRHRSAKQACEPVFSINADIGFQDMQSVFQAGITDPVLCNAILYTLSFASKQDSMDPTVLKHRGQTMRWINQRMKSDEEVMTAATLGAILLLVGVEARAGAQFAVKIHMNGVKQILHLCDARGIMLHEGIKRAIYWQDLFCAVLTESETVLDNGFFTAIDWMDDPFEDAARPLTSGFWEVSGTWDAGFIDLLRRIHALQIERDAWSDVTQAASTVAQMDNKQAYIESRLHSIRLRYHAAPDVVLRCSVDAAYICTYMLFTSLWDSSMVPAHLSANILNILERSDRNILLATDSHLLLWILCVGGSFAGSGQAQMAYAFLLGQLTQQTALQCNKQECLVVLNTYIWSDKTFTTAFDRFWALSQPPK